MISIHPSIHPSIYLSIYRPLEAKRHMVCEAPQDLSSRIMLKKPLGEGPRRPDNTMLKLRVATRRGMSDGCWMVCRDHRT